MGYILHKADTRGLASHGWLTSRHTFSFANYYNPERMNFGALRVLNDDIVLPGMGFGTHPHENMEIISIPLKGALEHKDSMGNIHVIRKNDIQVMSAGTGIMHSEYNHSKTSDVNFLQIWVIPEELNISPRYDQRTFEPKDRENRFQNIVTPSKYAEGVWINQQAWFYLGSLTSGISIEHRVKRRGNGVYIFVLEGTVEIDGNKLELRDGIGIYGVEEVTITALNVAEVLLMDVPIDI